MRKGLLARQPSEEPGGKDTEEVIKREKALAGPAQAQAGGMDSYGKWYAIPKSMLVTSPDSFGALPKAMFRLVSPTLKFNAGKR